MIPVGTLVAGHRIRGVLGSGGMGTVYAADDPNLPRVVALKILPGDRSADPKFRARFLREAEVAGSLDHPNIVSVYDRGETPDGRLWISMQLIDGTDAGAELHAGTMTAPRAVHITTEIAKALDYSHARNLLHRDVKPSNFLLSGPPGPDERVLLADFGVASFLDEAARTATTDVAASLAYIAPELLHGQPAGPGADLYSLGCSLYELLTGATPFHDVAGMPAQVMAHLQRQPPAVTAIAGWLSPAFDTVVATAMAKDPAQRYPSGAELAAAATAALRQSTPPAAVPAAAAAPPARASGARRTTVLAGIGALVLAGGAATALLVSRGGSGPAQPATASTAAAPTAAARVLGSADLPALLRTSGQLSALTGPLDPKTEIGIELVTGIASSGDPLCTGVVFPTQKSSYPAGVTGIYAQKFTTGGHTAVIEAVVALPSAEAAAQFLTRATQVWTGCNNTDLSAGDTEKIERWQISDVTATGDIVTARTHRSDDDKTCRRALTARGNVVVDVATCLPAPPAGAPDPAATIAGDVADSIPH